MSVRTNPANGQPVRVTLLLPLSDRLSKFARIKAKNSFALLRDLSVQQFHQRFLGQIRNVARSQFENHWGHQAGYDKSDPSGFACISTGPNWAIGTAKHFSDETVDDLFKLCQDFFLAGAQHRVIHLARIHVSNIGSPLVRFV